MKNRFFVIRVRNFILLGAALALAAGIAAANAPAAVSALAAVRQLPIYCVERDQKMCSVTFDAAWGDGIMRLLYLCTFASRRDGMFAKDRS